MEPVNLLYIVKTLPDKITILLETTVSPLDTIKSFVRFEQIKSVIRSFYYQYHYFKIFNFFYCYRYNEQNKFPTSNMLSSDPSSQSRRAGSSVQPLLYTPTSMKLYGFSTQRGTAAATACCIWIWVNWHIVLRSSGRLPVLKWPTVEEVSARGATSTQRRIEMTVIRGVMAASRCNSL